MVTLKSLFAVCVIPFPPGQGPTLFPEPEISHQTCVHTWAMPLLIHFLCSFSSVSVTEPFCWVLWGFLFFVLLTAVAKILPDSFKRDFKDPWRRPHMLAKEKQPSYCVYFRLKQVGAACRLHLWSSQLQKERQVCVECRRDAVGSTERCEGDGLEQTRTFWTATTIAGCQGSWIQESLQENCVCPPLSFIFV